MSDNNTILGQLNDFLSQVHQEKVASEKVASEMGDKETTHPSKSTDDQTQAATEGSRSSENSADVKKQVPGQAVDEAEENKAMDVATESMGTASKATGEASEVEDDYKGDKDDPGTSHPMNTNDGEKYGQDMSIDDITKLANDISAHIAVLTKKESVEKEAEETKTDDCPKADEPAAEKQAEDAKVEVEPDFVKAGYDTAQQFIESLEMAKKAAAEEEAEIIESITKEAEADAEGLVNFLIGYTKQAEGEEQAEAEAAAQLGGGGGEGDVPAEGPAPEAAPAPGPEMPAEAAGGAPEGGLGEEEMQALAALLAEEGIDPSVLAEIDPEALALAIQEAEAGGMGGEMAGGMGGGEELAPDAGGLGGLAGAEGGGMPAGLGM